MESGADVNHEKEAARAICWKDFPMHHAARRFSLATLVAALITSAYADSTGADYAVVVSDATHKGADWARVVETLIEKHRGNKLIYESSPEELLDQLKRLHPRYTCFVVKPTEATRSFVSDVHKLTRKYDGDPYTDTIWGILTGYDAANALRIAEHNSPLIVRKVASGTEVALEMCEEGVWYCELVQNKMVQKKRDGRPEQLKGPSDTTETLVKALNEYGADLFVTSGHATERDWSIGYRYRNGQFRSGAGQLYGLDTTGRRHEINSPNPKVYMPVGNCLMGHIDGPDAMALAWMNDAGVHQMIGYTVSTWYGYAGWGCLDYFVEQPGRFTFAEAFHANQHALVHGLLTCFPDIATADTVPSGRTRSQAPLSDKAKAAGLNPQDGMGLLFDRDVLAFYGDPKWSAKMADRERAWEQTLIEDNGVYTFTITPKRGPRTFEPINMNGSQRGWRPIVQFFESRLADVEVLEGADLEPAVTDDFILIPNPRIGDPNRTYRVRFKARTLR
jgi:zinc protease